MYQKSANFIYKKKIIHAHRVGPPVGRAGKV